MTTEAFRAAPRLALDTEFVWTKTYWARLGLVQAAGSDGFDRTRLHATPPAAIPLPRDASPELARTILLDPLAASSVPLGGVLRDPSTVKILHDAHQDLVHLARWTGEKPVSVFDTKIAAGFCGLSSGCSLARLVRELSGVVLPKTETRSDWCRRPLHGEQLVYAAQDVAYLDEAACELVRRAERAGTARWMMEEMERFDDPRRYEEEDVRHAVHRVSVPPGAIPREEGWRARRRLRALATWRETEARRRDLPRKWIVSDETLVAAASKPPRSAAELPPKSLPPCFEEGFFAAIREADSTDFSPEEEEALRRSDETARAKREARDKATAVLARVAELARAAGVDPALVGSRADVTEWVIAPDDSSLKLNRGWRRELAGGELRRFV